MQPANHPANYGFVLKIIAFCLFAGWIINVHATNAPISTEDTGNRRLKHEITHRYYGVRDGLAQSQVFYGFQDSYGYLWFSTNEGVSRFDGVSFQTYHRENRLVPGGRVRYIDQHGDVLFFVSGAGVGMRYPDGRIEHYPLPDGYRSVLNTSLDYKQGKHLYIFNCEAGGTVGDYLQTYPYFVFDLDTKKYTKSSYHLPVVLTILKGEKGLVAYCMDGKTKRQTCLLGEDQYTKLQQLPLIHHPAFFTIGSDQFIGMLDKSMETVRLTLEKDSLKYEPIGKLKHLFMAIQLKDHRFYIAHSRGHQLCVFDGKAVTDVPIETSIINHVLMDRDNNLWLSTEEGVFNCYNQQFEFYKPGLTRNDNIWDMRKDVYGNLWFSSYGQGFWRADPQGNLQRARFMVNNQPKELTYGYMGGTEDALGRLYLNYSYGVAVFDPRKGNTTRLEGVEIGTSLIAYYDSLTNKVYCSGNNQTGEMYVVSLDHQLRTTIHKSSYGYILSVSRDGNGRLRYGTGGEEGYLDEETGRLVADTLKKDYRVLVSMALDNTGILWKATSHGLFAEDRSGKDTCITDETLSFVTNYRNRYLLYGGVKGTLYILDLQDYHENRTVSVRHFGYNQGVDVLEFGQNGCSIDHDGYCWLTGGDNVLRFHPDSLMHLPDYTVTSPFIASIAHADRNNEWQLFDSDRKEMKLKNDENFLRFEILQAFPAAPERLRFRYRLKGFSDHWQYETERVFIFQNLPHGKYRLEAQATVDGTHWSDSAVSPVITIGRPFWLTVPGILLQLVSFFLFLLFVAWLVRQRILRMQRRQREIDRLKYRAVRSKYIPHFTGNVLNSISYLMTKDREQAQKYITEFSQFSSQTLLNSENIYRTLAEELEYARLYLELEKLRFEDRLEYALSVSPDADQSLRIPAMILQTFCENALKHGLRHKNGVGKVNIAVRIETNYHILSVEDNGIGREKARQMKTEGTGEGLSIIEQQLSLFYTSKNQKARMEIIDLYDNENQPSGTRFEVYIPSDTHHANSYL